MFLICVIGIFGGIVIRKKGKEIVGFVMISVVLDRNFLK